MESESPLTRNHTTNNNLEVCMYSVVSIKRTGGNKRTGRAGFFHLLHEKQVCTGWGKNFKIVKGPCSLNRYYRVLLQSQSKPKSMSISKLPP